MQKSNSHAWATLAIYWQHIRKEPYKLTGALFAIPLTTLVNSFIPPLLLADILQKLATGNYSQSNIFQSFGPTIIVYCLLVIFGGIFWRLVDFFMWRLEANMLVSLATTIYNKLLSLSPNFHANSFSGSLVSQTNKFTGSYVRIADTTAYGVLPMIWSLIFASILLANRAPLFVVGLLSITFVYVISAVYISKRTRIASAEAAEAESRQTGVVADSLTNVMAIKSYSGYNFEKQRFAVYTADSKRKLFGIFRAMAVQLSIFSVLSGLVEAMSLVAAVFAVVNRDANLASVFLVLNFSNTIADNLFSFSQTSLKNYNRAIGDAYGMTETLTTPIDIKDPETPEPIRMQKGAINFDDVTFTHNGSKSALFQSFSLAIKPGERIGLVGHSGSGKTTLTRLLLRFSDIDSGSITIDGQDIRNVAQDDLHEHITYVPQEPMLFHRSLAENISYGKRDASLAEIIKFSKLAHAHEFIKDLPQGYKTLVGERGVKLSGGQRQRVAIARAMIKDAPIVVLDEATSALDSESEILIQKALWKLMEGRTAIVIAHRLSTIQKMDRIVVMDNGRITEEGSHVQLLKKKGKYAELWAHQSGGFIEE